MKTELLGQCIIQVTELKYIQRDNIKSNRVWFNNYYNKNNSKRFENWIRE